MRCGDRNGASSGCELFVNLNVVAGREAGVGRVRERAGLACLLGIIQSEDLVEVVDVAGQALGPLAVEDVGADRSFFGCR